LKEFDFFSEIFYLFLRFHPIASRIVFTIALKLAFSRNGLKTLNLNEFEHFRGVLRVLIGEKWINELRVNVFGAIL
jgi:hypothetical protein